MFHRIFENVYRLIRVNVLHIDIDTYMEFKAIYVYIYI